MHTPRFLQRPLQLLAQRLLASACHPRYGQWPPHSLPFARLSFSQFGEDLVLERLLHDMGCGHPYSYVDVGCFHPVEHSNTYRLYQRGGSGLVVDLNPEHEAPFRALRPRDKFVCAVVSDRGEKLATAVTGRPTDRVTGRAAEAGEAGREPVSLASLLAQHWNAGRSIDLMDIDCEGHDLEVLRSNDWERFRPAVVLVEDFGQEDSAVCKFMDSLGYRLAFRVGASCAHTDTKRRL
jgi:FkbM family methyltransferase